MNDTVANQRSDGFRENGGDGGEHGSNHKESGLDKLLEELTRRGLGFSLEQTDGTDGLMVAKIWKGNQVVSCYIEKAGRRLGDVVSSAMFQVDWREYPFHSANSDR